MESIRILQDTYEKLYAITPKLGNLLETEFSQLNQVDWRDYYVDSFLQKKKVFKKEWNHLYEIDSYYLLELLKENWNLFREKSDSNFFNLDNFNLFVNRRNKVSIISIRNEVAHPEYWDYDIETYRAWKKSLDKAAFELGSDMSELLYELHKPEKDKMLSYILDNTTNITLKSEKLSDDIRNSVLKTKSIMEQQTTAAGIIAFFSDALKSLRGQQVVAELKKLGLPLFEDIKDEVFDMYYGIDKD
ncbi:hypothetical protein DYE50_11355 [Treponema ruminis]|uniref:Uncharacterized protein n=1 Tax=Treponema ruminis TaxID=744515 RepID=A0A7W8G8Q1_9SPIR|nr:hypothetical protein [Treponema ruminis]MBB5225923.1 hypothetical protein [Treponema ruminis]QSI03164.1 hypothetical protein DYE50_11355 [Treponema ruminis]